MMRLILALVAALWLCAPASAFTRVQGGSANAFGGTLTLSCPLSAVTSGNFVWGTFYTDFTPGDAITVVDNASPTPNVYNVTPLTTGATGLMMYWRGNVTGAPTSIIGTDSSLHGNWVTTCEEWSGVNSASDPHDGTTPAGNIQATPGTGANGITSSSITTTTNGDLILGVTANTSSGTAVVTAGTGFALTGTSYNANIAATFLEQQTQSTAGAISATFTQAAANSAITFVLAVKPPGGGGGGLNGPAPFAFPF